MAGPLIEVAWAFRPVSLSVDVRSAGPFGLLASVLALSMLVGCAGPRQWGRGTLAQPSQPAPPAHTMRLRNADEAAALLAVPGDILVMHLGDSRMGSWAKQLGVYPASVTDLLDLQDPFTKYLHAEIVVETHGARALRSKGFYPLIKEYHGNQFGRSFAIYTVTDGDRAQALRRAADEGYAKTGYCGDFVSWCHEDRIYSWWNRLPGLRRVVTFVYPPEAIQTADHLAQSPDTSLVLEVLDGDLVYPRELSAADLLKHLDEAAKSHHPAVRGHVEGVRARLRREGVTDDKGRAPGTRLRLVW